MFRTIFIYELKYWLKQPSIYIYILFFLGVSTLAMAGICGAFDPPSNDSIAVKENTAINIYTNINYLTILILFLLPAIIGNSVYRDYKSNMHYILYSYPFKKRGYLFAKFFSSFFIVLLIISMIGLGVILGTQVPGVNPNRLLPFNIWAYIQIYVVFLIPNIFLYGAIVFGVVTFSRNVYAGFITVGLLLFVPQLIINIPMHDYALCLLDPFGEYAVKYGIKEWTTIQQNELLLPVTNLVIFNRLLWLTISIILFSWVYKTFSFNQTGNVITLNKKTTIKNEPSISNTIPTERKTISKANHVYSLKQQLNMIWKLSSFDFYAIIKSWPFITILLAGFIVVIFLLLQMNSPFENDILPVTWIILTFPVLFYSLVVKILTFLYAGITIQRGRSSQMNYLIDINPVKNWVFMTSKLLAIIKMQFALQIAVMIAGITIQLSKGYFNFDIKHYIIELLFLNMIGYVLWAMLSILIHSIIKNVYLGLFTLIVILFGVGALPELGVEHPVFLFNETGQESIIPFTDMNGYGHRIQGFLAYKLYWFIGSIGLLLTALLLWNRGVGRSFKERIALLKIRFQKKLRYAWLLTFSVFLIMGGSYYYETTVRNPMVTNDTIKGDYANFEKEFSAFAKAPQPKITTVNIHLDIFPESESFQAKGEYTLVNKTTKPIDTLLIRTGFDEVSTFSVNVPYEIVKSDSLAKFSVVKLQNTLSPMDTLIMKFDIQNTKNTLFQTNSNVGASTTFLKTDVFPRLGYLDRSRSFPYPEDADLSYTYTSEDADLIDFEATVSTSKDQIAIATGYLQKEWSENDRNYYHYKMDQKIKFEFGFNSSAYELYEDSYKDIAIQVYHHPDHVYNIENMVAGIKAALAYNTTSLSAYQHKEVRIIEFPITMGSYATVFANTIPFSEVRFLADISKNTFNLPFYVASHEMAHQWWGNQVTPARSLGYQMITESPAEYFALKSYEHHFGKEPVQAYLDAYMKQYLRVHKRIHNEKPLIYTDGYQKIPYIKGALAFYGLSQRIGEQHMNTGLRNYLTKVRYQNKPYTTSLEMVEALKRVTPDSLHYVLKDAFETVTLYTHTITNTSMKTINDQYVITMDFEVKKERTTKEGAKEKVPLHDDIEIVVFGDDNTQLYRRQHKITQEKNSVQITVKEIPSEIAIDPFHLSFNRNAKNNRKKL